MKAPLWIALTFAVSGFAADMTYQGYLVDKACGAAGMSKMDGSDEINAPQEHTVACQLACAPSGYGVMVKEGMAYKFVPFDAKGSELALKLLKETKKEKAPWVVVTGSLAMGTLKVVGLKEATM